MKVYTKTGDQGQTGILGAGRLSKSHERIEAYGSVDELNASLGIVRALGVPSQIDMYLGQIQDELFLVGSAMADPDPNGTFFGLVTPEHVARLERAIDVLEEQLRPLTQFILPGGTVAAAHLHLSRTICRRAERETVALREKPDQQIGEQIVPYLNRLSDLLFVMARAVNQMSSVNDVPWSGLTNTDS